MRSRWLSIILVTCFAFSLNSCGSAGPTREKDGSHSPHTSSMQPAVTGTQPSGRRGVVPRIGDSAGAVPASNLGGERFRVTAAGLWLVWKRSEAEHSHVCGERGGTRRTPIRRQALMVGMNPVPGPRMGKENFLYCRYFLTGASEGIFQHFSLTREDNNHIRVSGLEQGKWAEVTLNFTRNAAQMTGASRHLRKASAWMTSS